MKVAVGEGILVAVDVGIGVGVGVAGASPNPQAESMRMKRPAMLISGFFIIRTSGFRDERIVNGNILTLVCPIYSYHYRAIFYLKQLALAEITTFSDTPISLNAWMA